MLSVLTVVFLSLPFSSPTLVSLLCSAAVQKATASHLDVNVGSMPMTACPQTKAQLQSSKPQSFYTCFGDWHSLWLKRELLTDHTFSSPLYLMEASLSKVLYYCYTNTKEQIQTMFFLKALKSNRHKMTRSRAYLLLFIYIKTFILLKLFNLDLNGAGGQCLLSCTWLWNI